MTDELAFYAAHGAITDPVKGWPKGVETDFAVGLA